MFWISSASANPLHISIFDLVARSPRFRCADIVQLRYNYKANSMSSKFHPLHRVAIHSGHPTEWTSHHRLPVESSKRAGEAAN
jgi:hypothetical protein